MSSLRDALRDLPDGVFFDLLESEEAYLVVVDVPGVSAETVDVTVEDGSASIEASRAKDLPEEYRYVEENRAILLDLSIPLPDDAAEEGAETAITDGVLELRLRKESAAVGSAMDTAGASTLEAGSDEPTGGDGA